MRESDFEHKLFVQRERAEKIWRFISSRNNDCLDTSRNIMTAQRS